MFEVRLVKQEQFDTSINSIYKVMHHTSVESKGSRIVTTRNGLIGNLPKQCQHGDVVAILYGWRTRFLLRTVSTGYLLLGECYVFGIMHGESISDGLGIETTIKIV